MKDEEWLEPLGDAGDAIDFACGHCAPDEAVAFLDDWRADRAGKYWPGYVRWLNVQHEGAKRAKARATAPSEVTALLDQVKARLSGHPNPAVQHEINRSVDYLLMQAVAMNGGEALPAVVSDDLRRLVIAARRVAFGGLFDGGDPEQCAAIKEIDEASEAFAAIVPWEDGPDA